MFRPRAGTLAQLDRAGEVAKRNLAINLRPRKLRASYDLGEAFKGEAGERCRARSIAGHRGIARYARVLSGLGGDNAQPRTGPTGRNHPISQNSVRLPPGHFRSA